MQVGRAGTKRRCAPSEYLPSFLRWGKDPVYSFGGVIQIVDVTAGSPVIYNSQDEFTPLYTQGIEQYGQSGTLFGIAQRTSANKQRGSH